MITSTGAVALTGKPEPSIFVIDVRDSNDFTTLLDWQSQSLAQGDPVVMGVSWVPEHPDTYRVSVVELSNFTYPQPLGGTFVSDPAVVK